MTVSRTDDDLLRYHNKMLLIDRETLYTLGFNFMRLDIEKSRSMGVATKNKTIVCRGHQAVRGRLDAPALHGESRLTFSSARRTRARASSQFIKGAKKELLIYDMKISDRQMIKLLQERVKAGVDVRIIGKVSKRGEGLTVEKMPGLRLHVRAMLRDGQELFLGSMSLRALELDKRREVGVIVKERTAAKQFREMFEEDWSKTESGKKKAEKDKKGREARGGRGRLVTSSVRPLNSGTRRSSRTCACLRRHRIRRPYVRPFSLCARS